METANEVINLLSGQFNLTDADIAKRVGSTQPTIWRLRSGKTKDCSADLYRNLYQLMKELANQHSQSEQEAA